MAISNSSHSIDSVDKISVVIPAFQEESCIASLVGRLRKVDRVHEVIVVDDGSTDQTALNAKTSGAIVLSHPYNRGNGAAIKTGIRHASGDLILLMDADGQHDPDEIGKLLGALGGHDMVIGERNLSQHATFLRFLANKIYNFLASYVTQHPITDLTSGFRLVRARVLKKVLYLLPNTFSYPTTLTLALLRSGYTVKFVPVRVLPRQGQKSKIRLFRDGARFFLIITKVAMLFSPLRVFLPVSFLLALCSIGNYAYTFFRFHRFTNMSALLAMTSVLIFMMGLIAEQIAMLRMDRSEEG